MPVEAPKIDTRTSTEIVQQVETLAQTYSDWRPPAGGQLDAGRALIHIFGRLAELVIERLNQVPDKNFLAFLDLIGTQILPPQPARVPLTFQLATGSPVDALVPARTLAAAPAAGGDEGEVLFETDRDLVVTTAQLAAIFVRDPDTDQYGDYTGAEQSFPVFAGNQPIEHSLYLARDDYFTLPAPKAATVTIDSPDADRLANLPIVWSFWDGANWQPLSTTSELPTAEQWQVSIADLPAPVPQTINGIEAGWVQARLAVPLPGGKLTIIDEQQEQVEIRRAGLMPEAAVSGQSPLDLNAPYYPFSPTEPVAHFFYLKLDEPFVRTGALLTLDVVLAETGNASGDLRLNWSFWNGSTWQSLGESTAGNPSVGSADFAFSDETQAFTQDGTIKFTVPAGWQVRSLFGDDGRWLRVQLVTGDYGTGATFRPPQIHSLLAAYTWELPRIDRIQIGVQVVRQDLMSDLSFFNALPLDTSKDFYPFGEKPRLSDTLYLSSQEVFARPGATVTVDVRLTNPIPAQGSPDPSQPPSHPLPVLASRDLEIVWEVWNGRAWQELGRSTPDGSASSDNANFTDKTQAFTRNGPITFTLPPALAEGVVNGESAYWVRARIARGNYGQEASYRPTVDEERQVTVYELVPATFAPPVVASLRLNYDYRPPAGPPSACWTYNDFTYQDQTSRAASNDERYFLPFIPPSDPRPTLYLGFDRRFANRAMTLYAGVEPPLYEPDDLANRRAAATEPAQITWEYSTSTRWVSLGAQDETHAFADRGLITFIGPADFTARSEFGRECFWLRARWESGLFAVAPRLRRLLTNTTWASQAVTVHNENLGSSNGEPRQTFRTSKAPVLLNPHLEVREPEQPSATERDAIARDEGADAIRTVVDASNRPQEIWVRWHQVPDFHGSGSRDRHYVLDHLTGMLYFGDGRNGMVPPQGRNNLRMARYRTGGGTRGNRPAHTVTQLKSTVPYVDGVTNQAAAEGGAEQETLAKVKERGPKTLRHRNRAVTAQDFEDLAYEASTEVARAWAIAARDGSNAGETGLILVPKSTEAQPIPSLELVNRVEAYLRFRSAPTLDLWIGGPDWVRVTIRAHIAPISFEGVDALKTAVMSALQRFLHPLTGGLDGNGWNLGRKPHRSDLYALLESVAGVDHIRSLQVSEEEVGSVHPGRFLIFSGTHEISLAPPGEGP